jgi:hypothetical protein
MKSIQLTVQVSDNGLLQLNLPPEFAGQKIELTLQIFPRKRESIVMIVDTDFRRNDGILVDDKNTYLI